MNALCCPLDWTVEAQVDAANGGREGGNVVHAKPAVETGSLSVGDIDKMAENERNAVNLERPACNA